MVKTYTPTPEVHKKLMDELKRLFPAHFAEANIYPVGKTNVDTATRLVRRRLLLL
jgi:hypothetical protein